MSHLPGGFPWRALGSVALLFSGECPSRSRSYPPAPGVAWLALRPVHTAPCRPCCCASLQSISAFVSWCLGGRGSIPAVVSARRSSCRNVRRCVLPGGAPSPFYLHSGVARSIPAGWPLWTGHGGLGVRKCLTR